MKQIFFIGHEENRLDVTATFFGTKQLPFAAGGHFFLSAHRWGRGCRSIEKDPARI